MKNRSSLHARARHKLSSRHGAHAPRHHPTRLAVRAGGGEGRAVVAPEGAHAARVDVGGVHVRTPGEGGARVRVRPRALSCRPRRRRRRHALAELGGGASQQRRHAARPRAHREARTTQLGLHVVVVEGAPVRRASVACRRRSGVSCGAERVCEPSRPFRDASHRTGDSPFRVVDVGGVGVVDGVAVLLAGERHLRERGWGRVCGVRRADLRWAGGGIGRRRAEGLNHLLDLKDVVARLGAVGERAAARVEPRLKEAGQEVRGQPWAVRAMWASRRRARRRRACESRVSSSVGEIRLFSMSSPSDADLP